MHPKQHYGLAEAVANISQCESGRLHVDEDYAYTEFVPDENGGCRIIGTGFSNSAVSLLRYDTGDLATPSAKPCDCGRPGRIVETLDGRLTDYVVLPDGRRVASLAGPFHATQGLAAAQLYQGRDGALTVRYVPGAEWRDAQLKGLETQLRMRLGNEISLAFDRVENIEAGPRGKTKLVVSDYAGASHVGNHAARIPTQ